MCVCGGGNADKIISGYHSPAPKLQCVGNEVVDSKKPINIAGSIRFFSNLPSLHSHGNLDWNEATSGRSTHRTI